MTRPVKHLDAARRYFGDGARTQVLAPGEALMVAGQTNTRLYLVLDGQLRCEGEDETGRWRELFVLRRDDLAGVTSFFGRPHRSVYTYTAIGEVSLTYLDRADIPGDEKESVDARLVPLVVHALHRRDVQRNDLERMLGVAQFGAGIAHELNNALSVVTQSWSWFDRVAARRLLEGRDHSVVEAFEAGRSERPAGSAAEVRTRAAVLAGRFGWAESFARRWARAGLDDPAPGTDPDEALEFYEMGEVLRDATSAVLHTRHVLDQMSALGRRREPHTTTFDVRESVVSGLALVKNVLATIDVEVTGRPGILVSCDRLQLEQVWANLARNAANALRGPDAPIEAALEVECDEVSGMARIRFTDNGPGIPPDLLPDIFLPRVSASEGRVSMGLGLGLSLARSVVTGNGGVIEARNVPPKGAQVEVRLPLARPSPDDRAPDENGAAT